MKTIFVTLALLVAFFQASSSESTEVTRQIGEALDECVSQLNFKKDEVIEHLKRSVIPEDNQDAIDFFTCFSKALNLINDDGDTDFEKLRPIVQDMIKQRLTTLTDDAAQRIATEAIEHCKDTPKAANAGLTAIKVRNCIRAYTSRPQTH